MDIDKLTTYDRADMRVLSGGGGVPVLSDVILPMLYVVTLVMCVL